MTVTQVYQLVNSATSELLGEQAVLSEDLSNIADVGVAIGSLETGYDRYCRSLVNHIGKVIFVNRKYQGNMPSLLMDGWEFGSIAEKVRMVLPDAVENEDWELTSGTSYDPNVFKAPEVSAKFFNKMVTFEIDASFTEMQVKQSFSNATQLNAFVSMLYTGIENSLTVKIDALAHRLVTTAIGETIKDAFPSTTTYTTAGNTRAINLLKLYNDQFSKSLTKDNCIYDADFIRYAVYYIGLIQSRMTSMSKLFNIGGTEKFTPADRLHTILIADFERSARVYLYDANGQLKSDNLKLPEAEVVPYWQGTGTSYAWSSTSKVYASLPSGKSLEMYGVLGICFDRDAMAIANVDRRVTTHYNAKGEFYNNFYKFDARYMLDKDENIVVFFVQ